MAVSKQVSFEVEGVPNDLLAPMVHALSDMRCYKFGREGLMVTARTPINWRSVGEIMSVRLSEAGSGRTLVEASSHSALRTVIFDWGKNDYNLRRFEAAFHTRLAQQAAKAE